MFKVICLLLLNCSVMSVCALQKTVPSAGFQTVQRLSGLTTAMSAVITVLGVSQLYSDPCWKENAMSWVITSAGGAATGASAAVWCFATYFKNRVRSSVGQGLDVPLDDHDDLGDDVDDGDESDEGDGGAV